MIYTFVSCTVYFKGYIVVISPKKQCSTGRTEENTKNRPQRLEEENKKQYLIIRTYKPLQASPKKFICMRNLITRKFAESFVNGSLKLRIQMKNTK